MEIEWSLVGFEMLNFGLFVVLLKRFGFEPVKRALKLRQEAIEAERLKLEAREAAAAATKAEYEELQQRLDAEIRQHIDDAIADGRARGTAAFEEGRAAARKMLEDARGEIGEGQQRALRELRREVFSLATAAAARIVRNMAERSVTRAFARRAAHALQDRVDKSVLSTEAIAVTIPAREDPDELVAELRATLGAGATFQIHTDPELVAGVRLCVAGHEVESSVSATLGAWYAERLAFDEDSDPSERTSIAG